MSDSEAISPFDQLIGTEWLESRDDKASARFAVSDHHKQPFGMVHGGLYAALAESVCSMATGVALWDGGKIALGQTNETSLLRPVSEGHVTAYARRRHAGRTTWVWEVDLRDDDGRLCAVSRITLAVRDR